MLAAPLCYIFENPVSYGILFENLVCYATYSKTRYVMVYLYGWQSAKLLGRGSREVVVPVFNHPSVLLAAYKKESGKPGIYLEFGEWSGKTFPPPCLCFGVNLELTIFDKTMLKNSLTFPRCMKKMKTSAPIWPIFCCSGWIVQDIPTLIYTLLLLPPYDILTPSQHSLCMFTVRTTPTATTTSPRKTPPRDRCTTSSYCVQLVHLRLLRVPGDGRNAASVGPHIRVRDLIWPCPGSISHLIILHLTLALGKYITASYSP